jgi:DNA-binding NtrC family response regulator
MGVMPVFPMIARAMGGALIASPDGALREQVRHSLNGRWRPVQHALGGAEALVKLEERDWHVLFLDRRLPDLDSEELAPIIRQRFPQIKVVMLDSGAALPFREDGTIGQPEPLRFEPGLLEQHEDQDKDKEDRHREKESQRHDKGPGKYQDQDQNKYKNEGEVEETSDHLGKNENEAGARAYEPLPGMIGRSKAMQRIYRLAQLVAPRTTTVLVVGATGSGKELVARALHLLSPRAAKAFVAVNCAAIPEALLESELFGHVRGAFTGAVQPQVGRIPAAHGGTLFLDEVSELPLGMQAKLLRFLEQKEVQRLGTAELTRVDVRVIAASNVDLAGRAGRGEFREDLFYRLSAFPLELPALSERPSDIIPLAEHFLACMAAAMSGPCPRLSGEAIGILEAHPWKGNVRELQHVMERASILVENGDTVLSEHLYFPFQTSPARNAARPLACSGRAS